MFTEADVKTLLRAATGSSAPTSSHSCSLLPPSLELVSGGLILEKHAISVIEQAIFSERPDRISLLDLASLTNLQVKDIESLLPSNDKPGWGRVGSSTIISRTEYIALKEGLRELLKHAVLNVSIYCQEKSIDFPFFRKLLQESTESLDTLWLGYDRNMICTQLMYDDGKASLKLQLARLEEPIDIVNLLPDRHLPLAFISLLVKDVVREGSNSSGTLKGTIFTPFTFIDKKRDNLIQRLRQDFILDFKSLNQEGIENVEQFVRTRLPESHLLENYVLTEEYVNQLKVSIQEKLAVCGWAEVKGSNHKFTPADQKTLLYLLKDSLEGFDKHSGLLISKTLINNLTEKAMVFAVQQADLAPKSNMNDAPLKSFKLQDLSLHLAGFTTLPALALASLLHTIYPNATESFSNHLASLKSKAIKGAQDNFWEKGYVRFQLHNTALQAINEGPLRTKLAMDLVDYSREHLLGLLEKYKDSLQPGVIPSPVHELETVLQHRNTKAKPSQLLQDIDDKLMIALKAMNLSPASDEILEHQKRKLIGELCVQLQKTNDAPLAIAITLILAHARLSPGVLKASGKYVPKLLSMLQGRIDPQVMGDLVRVKDAVVSRTKLTGDDFSRLRQIGES